MNPLRIVGITAAGEQISLFPLLELEYLDTWGTCAQSLSARFLWEKALPELAYLHLYQGDSLFFTGIVDQQELLLLQGCRYLDLQARGMGALLLDNEAMPQTYVNATLPQIFSRHIQPYGFDGIHCSTDPVLSCYTISKGTSEWEVLETFCLRTLGTVPRIDPVGQIWVDSISTPNHLLLSNSGVGTPFLQLQDTTKQQEVLSQVVVRDSQYVYGTVVENPWSGSLPRRRYLIPASEWANYPSGNALLRIRESMAAKWSLTAVVPGLLEIFPGDVVTVEDDILSVSRQFVRQVCYTLGEKGAKTHITLGDGRFFQGEIGG